MEEEVYPVDKLKARLQLVLGERPLSNTNLSDDLNSLARYFSRQKDFQITDRNYAKYNNWRRLEVPHSDFLVNIVNSMRLAGTTKDEFLRSGFELINLTKDMYRKADDPGYFVGFVLPKLAEKSFVNNGTTLVESARISNKLKVRSSGAVFFPTLSDALGYGDINSLQQLSEFREDTQNYIKHLEKMKQVSAGL